MRVTRRRHSRSARSTATRSEVGCAVQSRYFSVGSVVPWAKAGVGAVATQAAGVAVYGPRALALLEEGLAPDEAIDARARRRRRSARRASSAWSRPTGGRRRTPGRSASRGPGHRVGDGYAVQGNILAGEAVVAEMERAFLETGGSLAERLVAVARGGPGRRRRRARAAVGGDRRRAGRRGAAVARGASTASASCGSRTTEPIAELRRLLGIHLVWDALRRASLFHAPGRYARGGRPAARGAGRSGEDAVLLYDLACFESLAGETEEALAHVARSVELDPGPAGGRGGSTRTSTRSVQDPRFAGARQLGSPAAWISTSTRARSSSAASASRCRRGGSRRRRQEARAAAEELGGQVVVKAQVLTGGRGKAGGIKLAEGPDEAEARARGDSRPRHPRPRRPQALDRVRLGDREGVLPLGHLRPRREAAAVHVHDAGRRGHRGGRGVEPGGARPAARRSVRGLPALAGAAADLRRRRRGSGGAEADRGDRREALRGVRRVRRDALRDQSADRDARRAR